MAGDDSHFPGVAIHVETIGLWLAAAAAMLCCQR